MCEPIGSSAAQLMLGLMAGIFAYAVICVSIQMVWERIRRK